MWFYSLRIMILLINAAFFIDIYWCISQDLYYTLIHHASSLPQNSVQPVSCVAGVRTVDDMVAAGSEDGTITIFQLPRVTLDTTASLSKHQLLNS